MKTLLLAMLGFVGAVGVCGCDDLTELVPVDGEECVVLFDGQVVIGERASDYTCHLGKMVYTRQPDGNYDESCVGSWLPSEEVCDANVVVDEKTGEVSIGIDEDCNFFINDVVYYYGDVRNSCAQTELGICKYSSLHCVNGQMVCSYDGFPAQERCDPYLYDEDCDGLTNEDDPSLFMDHPEFEYTGPDETLNEGLCRAGHWECIRGEEVLRGQVLPTEEICSTNQDEDCDGLIDEAEGDIDPIAFSILLDDSGSMGPTSFAVRDAICEWSTGARFQNSLFSIHAVGTGYPTKEPFITKITDFVGAITACDALQAYLQTTPNQGFAEYFPYAIWALNHLSPITPLHFDEPLSAIGISWPVGMTRRVVSFTDEAPHPYVEPLNVYQELTDVVQDCSTYDFVPGFFVLPEHDYLWDPVVQGCGGWIEYLSNDPELMRQKLDQRFGGEC